MASSDTEWDVAGESSGMPVDSLSECADAPAHEKAPGLLPPSGSGLSQQRTTQQQTASPAGSRDAAELVDAVQGLSLQPEGADAACVQGSQTEEEAPEARHLPDGVVRNIAAYLVSADAQTAFLSLLSLCGTCAQWRAVCSELPSQTPSLAFDSYDNFYTSRPLVQRFRKLSPAAKAEVFEAAATLFSGRARACARIAPGLAACAQGTMNFARLAAWVTCMLRNATLVGYSEVSFSGDATTDLALQRVAERVGPRLVKLKVHGSGVATDAGLRCMLHAAPHLQHVHLEDVTRITSGLCVVDLLERCTELQTLHLSGMPGLQWAAVYAPGVLTMPRRLTKLHARGVSLDAGFAAVLAKLPLLQELELDGPARNVVAASCSCPELRRVSYLVTSRGAVDEAVGALANVPGLQTLELIIKNCTLCSDQLRQIGSLPVSELRLDSYVYKQQPTLSRSSFSHVDNEGVKALVDSICGRWGGGSTEMQPLKLSLCGATALTHDAVSALLRLPILTELDIGGCCRIIAMDKMRLVAKVRAGREMLESGRRPNMRSLRFPGLFL